MPWNKEDYPTDWEWRKQQVKRRDGYQCVNCGERTAELDVHHKHGRNHGLHNLVTLCKPCHNHCHHTEFGKWPFRPRRHYTPEAIGAIRNRELIARDEAPAPDSRRYGGQEMKLVCQGATPTLPPEPDDERNDRCANNQMGGTRKWGFIVTFVCTVIVVSIAVILVRPNSGFDERKPSAPIDPKQSPNYERGHPTATSTLLIVNVPPDAAVWINDKQMSAGGTQRRYFSSGLAPEKRYQYRVHAQVEYNGTKYTQSQVTRIRPGETKALHFDFSSEICRPSDAKLRRRIGFGA
jgi:uncharacterized protein (TIGR03000 family)